MKITGAKHERSKKKIDSESERSKVLLSDEPYRMVPEVYENIGIKNDLLHR
jgi:hypothetical protein